MMQCGNDWDDIDNDDDNPFQFPTYFTIHAINNQF